MKVHRQQCLRALPSLMLALALAACTKGGSSSDSSTSGISISGTLTQQAASGLNDAVSRFEASFSTADTALKLDCGAAGSFSATVNSTTGAFSASGVPTGVPCTFQFVSATSDVVKCQVQFEDQNNYDLNNNPMTTSTATVTSNVDLGSITCGTDGNITIDSSSVANVSSGASVDDLSAFDFTGSYTVAAYDGTLPSGVQTAQNCTSNCHGPSVGEVISLVRFKGHKFTPNGGQCIPAINVSCNDTTDGVVDTTVDGYGMSIWGGDYAHGIGACGGNTGFTADEARAYARLSLDPTPPTLSTHALSYGHYAWDIPTGFGTDTGWTQPWMFGGALSQYPMQDCQPVSVPPTSGGSNKQGWACFSEIQSMGSGTGTFVWNVGLNNSGGCVDSNNKPVMVSNWPNLTGTCLSTASSFNSNLKTNSCTYTGAPVLGATSITFTCAFTGGAFNDISTGTGAGANNGPNFSSPHSFAMGEWPGQPATIIAKDDPCAGGMGHDEATLLTAAGGAASSAQAKAAKELLMRYQCYANAYWQNSSHGAGSTDCTRDYNFNWATNNFANFVIGDDRSMKPQNAFITDRVFYSPDGQWAFIKNVQNRYQTIPTPSGSTLCPMNNKVELKFKRVSDSKLMVDFSEITVMADKSAACQGAVVAALAGGGTLSPDPQDLNHLYEDLQAKHMIFYLNK